MTPSHYNYSTMAFVPIGSYTNTPQRFNLFSGIYFPMNGINVCLTVPTRPVLTNMSRAANGPGPASLSGLEPVGASVDFAAEEEKILEFWAEIKAFETSLQLNRHKKVFTFYDGPPFATGLPHYGHIVAGTIKDTVTRYAHMTGKLNSYIIKDRIGLVRNWQNGTNIEGFSRFLELRALHMLALKTKVTK